ncbi:MAG: hypothetical protein HDP34_04350 [Clostridia bacterium]|nr:hypothetical protein [Clostridia bacterium]
MTDSVFKYKSPVFNKLKQFGFIESDGAYSYVTDVLNGQFEMRVNILLSGEVKTELIDLSTGEPYTLHLVEEAAGAFVGEVRAEYSRVLTEIADKCFERDVFKSDCAHKLIEYVREKYGDELEYLWKTFPSNAVWRRKDNNKWYAAVLTVSKRKLGLDSDEVCEIIDLRIDPDELSEVVDGKKYFLGYHMNKKHWFTICLDGSVSAEEICSRIDKSYIIAEKA